MEYSRSHAYSEKKGKIQTHLDATKDRFNKCQYQKAMQVLDDAHTFVLRSRSAGFMTTTGNNTKTTKRLRPRASGRAGKSPT